MYTVREEVGGVPHGQAPHHCGAWIAMGSLNPDSLTHECTERNRRMTLFRMCLMGRNPSVIRSNQEVWCPARVAPVVA